MADDTWDRFMACSDVWQKHLDKNDFDGAIGVAVEAYAHYRGVPDEERAKDCLSLIAVAASAQLRSADQSTANPSCSFCGKGEDEVRIFAGPRAYICSECVNLLHGTLSTEKK